MADTAVPRAVIDFESYSEAELKETGAWVYAEHQSTDIICLAYKIEQQKTKLWVPDGSFTDFPADLAAHIASGGILEAFNAGFERAMFRHKIVKAYNIPMPRRWLDAQAVCAYRALPMKLDAVGDVLRLNTQKDKRGKYLIQRLCKPQPKSKKNPVRWRNRDPALLQELYDYCVRDVETEYELSLVIGDLPFAEYKLWILDQRINDRGVYVDLESVLSAKKIVERVMLKLQKELFILTGGAVTTHNELKQIHAWMLTKGYRIPTLEANVIDDALKNKLAPFPPGENGAAVRRVLEIRKALGKGSTGKLSSFIATCAADRRIHGLLQYHGAATGRWAGRLVQPQNFPRPQKHTKNMELLIELIHMESPEVLDIAFGDCMEAVAASLRGMIVAAPGCTFHVSDFSAIEARVTMWLAGQDDAMEIFEKSDRKEGPDIYCYTASAIYGREIVKNRDDEERQLGKIVVLGCGYQMGGERLKQQAEDDYKVYITLERAEELVKIYRAKYPKIPALWRGLEEAAIKTVQTGQPHHYSCITYEIVNDRAGKWLACRLPNGRRIWYYNPRVEQREVPRKDGSVWVKDTLFYEGKDNKHGGHWSPNITTYGGMLTENVVQAISRDLMAEAMERVEAIGYIIVLTVHDEIIAENPVDFGNQKAYEREMSRNPEWSVGCPIAVEGWSGARYKKG